MARLMSASLQSPMPLALLEVMLREVDVPHGPGNSRPPLPSELWKSAPAPGVPNGVWHSMQWAMVTR